MTQAVQPAPGPAPAPAPSVPGQAVPATPGTPAAAARTENTPQLLNRLQALAVAVCLVFAVASAIVQVLAVQANGRAADNTEQVVRIQEIQSSLLRADALATNGFLEGGLEDPAKTQAYDAAIDDVLRLTTDAAEAQPADRAVLADLNAAVRDYTTAVAQARDYNRQNLVLGIGYINVASAGLRADALPIMTALVSANSDRADEEFDAEHPATLFWIGLLALVALFLVNRMIARRFHRRVNVGLAVAATAVIVVTLLTAAVASKSNSDNEAIRDGSFKTAFDEATARTAANNAKATESQGLINRGSGATYEIQWDTQAAIVTDTASPATLRLWNEYVAQHRAIRDADDGGDWFDAVRMAISGEDGSATALLDEVDASAAQTVSDNATQATDDLRSGGAFAWVLIVLTLLAGMVAAAASTIGIAQRRREYA